MKSIPWWAWLIGAGAVVWLLKVRKDAPSTLTGEGANLAALAKSQAVQDPAQISLEINKLSAQASQITAALKTNPSLGTVLGLSPTQIDYAILPPETFRTTYGFTADPGLKTP